MQKTIKDETFQKIRVYCGGYTEAAKIIGVNRSVFWSWRRKKRVPTMRVAQVLEKLNNHSGNKFTLTELAPWIEEQKNKGGCNGANKND